MRERVETENSPRPYQVIPQTTRGQVWLSYATQILQLTPAEARAMATALQNAAAEVAGEPRPFKEEQTDATS